uniref:Uncharacterized protein n=1 Tax=Acrobeloides nanus TaxID=290746 RepID=A0A914BUA1_9BILA
MGAEAKRYLQEHSIPQLFESLMTGLIYNKPEDPIDFLDGCIKNLRQNPDLSLRWDSFVDTENGPVGLKGESNAGGVKKLSTKKGEKSKSSKKGELPPKSTHSSKERIASTTHNTDDEAEEKLNDIRISGIKAKSVSQQTTGSEENEY